MRTLKLKTNDDKIIDVGEEIAYCSETFQEMFKSTSTEDSDEEPIVLQRVNKNILEKVIKWATFHKDDLPPEEEDEKEKNRTDNICSFDAELVSVDDSTLFELIEAANYLLIKGLLNLACKAVAKKIEEKSVEEIRNMFNVEHDFTQEEEEMVRKENEWCEKM